MNGRPFVLLRSKKDESITESWLSEYVLIECEKRELVFYSEKISSNIEQICFNDKNGKKYIDLRRAWGNFSRKRRR